REARPQVVLIRTPRDVRGEGRLMAARPKGELGGLLVTIAAEEGALSRLRGGRLRLVDNGRGELAPPECSRDRIARRRERQDRRHRLRVDDDRRDRREANAAGQPTGAARTANLPRDYND